MSDYTDYDNLAFEPKMTWEQLCEWLYDFCNSKGLRLTVDISESGNAYALIMTTITIELMQSGVVAINGIAIYKRQPHTYEQMKTIIDALWG